MQTFLANIPLIPKVGPSSSTKKLFLWFSEWDDELFNELICFALIYVN